MKLVRIAFALLALSFGSTGWGQSVFLKYGPVAGIQKSTGATYQNTAATSADILSTLGSQTANTVLAAPNGSSGNPTFRALVGADVTPINLATTSNGGVLSTSILLGTNGGTSNGFFSITGPATSLKTFTFPNASATVLTTNAAVTVPQGGTGVGTFASNAVLLGEGTSNVSSVVLGADTVLRGTASADPVAAAVPNCGSATAALSYSTSTHTFGCQTITSGGTGTVTSITAGAGLSASPNPIISTGTVSLDLTANDTWTGAQVFAPSSGSGLITVNSTTSTNAALSFFNLAGVNKVRVGAEGTAGATVTGSAIGDVVIYSGSGFNVTTDAGDNFFRIDSTGKSTMQAATGQLVINSTTSTNAAGLLVGLGGTNKVRVLAEGTAGATVTGSSVGDLIAYTAGGNIDFSPNSGANIVMQITSAPSILGPSGVTMTPRQGTFTMTYNGFAAGNSLSATYYCIGNMCTLIIPGSAVSTSNAATFTATGLPATIQPAQAQQLNMYTALCEDNSVIGGFTCGANISGGTITFAKNGSASGWTASGQKGITTNLTVSYLLN